MAQAMLEFRSREALINQFSTNLKGKQYSSTLDSVEKDALYKQAETALRETLDACPVVSRAVKFATTRCTRELGTRKHKPPTKYKRKSTNVQGPRSKKCRMGSSSLIADEQRVREPQAAEGLPNDVLEHIMKTKFLKSIDVMSAGRTCVRWYGICKHIWQRKRSKELSDAWASEDYFPSKEELAIVELLATRGPPASEIIPRRVEALISSWDNRDYLPSTAEVNFSAHLAQAGHLPRRILTTKAASVIQRITFHEAFTYYRTYYRLTLTIVACAAALATHDYITELEDLWLHNLNLNSIPIQNLTNLVNSVRGKLSIRMISCSRIDLVLRSIRSKTLCIGDVRLDTANTKELLAIMTSHVESLELFQGIVMDIDTLTRYDGRGACRRIELFFFNNDQAIQNRLEAWVERMYWRIKRYGLVMILARK